MNNIRFVCQKITSFGVDEEVLREVVTTLRVEFWDIFKQHVNALDIDFVGIFVICMATRDMAEKFSGGREGKYKVTDAFTKEKSDWFTIPIILDASQVNQQKMDEVKLLILEKVINYSFHKEYKGKKKESYERYLTLLQKVAAELINHKKRCL